VHRSFGNQNPDQGGIHMSQASQVAEPEAAQKIQEASDILDQLMKPEVQQSLSVLVEQLPKLAEMTTALTKIYGVVHSIATDPIAAEDFKSGFGEVIRPITTKVKTAAAAAIEASDRVNESETPPIGLFGILKMLKDPHVQRMFKFLQAYLDVLSEQKKNL
jgi:uncharacterized protein YjgD (DUF1641 family)